MIKLKHSNLILLFAAIFVFSLTFEAFSRSRGGRGGGVHSISRSGGARTGSFKGGGSYSRQSSFSGRSQSSSRSLNKDRASNRNYSGTNQGSRNFNSDKRSDLQSNRTDNRSDLQSNRSDSREDWQDKRNDNASDLQEDRQNWKDDNREDWQEYGDKVRDERREYAEHSEWGEHGEWNEWNNVGEFGAGFVVGAVVGTVITAAAFNNNNCMAGKTLVGDVYYYQCGGSWYQQVYRGGEVTYIVVEAPY